VRIRVKSGLCDYVDELFDSRVLVLDDGGVSREVVRALAPFRRNGELVVGRDRVLGKSVLMLNNGVKGKRRKKTSGFGSFVYDIL